MFHNKSVNVHDFAMVPRADIPRSRFSMQKTLKTTFDSGYLVPIMCEEVLPGDTFNVNVTMFGRLATPLFPVMDNLHLDSFFFFVPNRLVWTNWVRFMGEQDNPSDSISYSIPQQVSPTGGYAVGSLQDYFGLPTVGQVTAGNTVSHSALPVRAYNLIFNEWFRDQNLQNSVTVNTGDGPDTSPSTNYVLLRRGKRHDYFTGALPWPQKGGTAVTIPIGTSAPVYGTGKAIGLTDGTNNYGFGTATAGTQYNASSTGAYNTNVGSAMSGTLSTLNKSLGVVTSGVSGLMLICLLLQQQPLISYASLFKFKNCSRGMPVEVLDTLRFLGLTLVSSHLMPVYNGLSILVVALHLLIFSLLLKLLARVRRARLHLWVISPLTALILLQGMVLLSHLSSMVTLLVL